MPGYSKSIRAFNRVKEFLDEMVAKEETIAWPHEDASTLAYRIREGIKVAKSRAADEQYPNREFFKPYSTLSSKFVVRVKGAMVVAEPRDIVLNQQAAVVLSRMVLEDVDGPLEIVGAAIKHKAPEMFFPSADLSPEELLRVYTWSSKHDYFIVFSEMGLTLTKTNPGEIAWQPSSPVASS